MLGVTKRKISHRLKTKAKKINQKWTKRRNMSIYSWQIFQNWWENKILHVLHLFWVGKNENQPKKLHVIIEQMYIQKQMYIQISRPFILSYTHIQNKSTLLKCVFIHSLRTLRRSSFLLVYLICKCAQLQFMQTKYNMIKCIVNYWYS